MMEISSETEARIIGKMRRLGVSVEALLEQRTSEHTAVYGRQRRCSPTD